MSKVLKRFPQEKITKFIKATNNYIYDDKDNRYLDMASNTMITNLGYGNERIINAMYKQAKELSYTHNGRYTTNSQEELARRLSGYLDNKYYVYFCSSGSEVIEAAMRISFIYQKLRGNSNKNKFVASSMSYHGSSLGALSVTGLKKIRENYKPILNEQIFINHNQLENEEINLILDDANICSLIIEPMSSNAMGSVMLTQNAMENIRVLTEKNEQLLIFDEISTAIGRTGKNFAFQYFEGIDPDLVCLSKGIGVGYSNIGAVLVKNCIAELILENDLSLLGHAYNGNPISCAVGNEVLNILEEEDYLKTNIEKGSYLMKKLSDIAINTPYIGEVRGKGLLISFQILNKDKTLFNKDQKIALKLYREYLKQGIITVPGSGGIDGELGEHITLAPSFSITYSEIDEYLEITNNIFGNFEQLILEEGYVL